MTTLTEVIARSPARPGVATVTHAQEPPMSSPQTPGDGSATAASRPPAPHYKTRRGPALIPRAAGDAWADVPPGLISRITATPSVLICTGSERPAEEPDEVTR